MNFCQQVKDLTMVNSEMGQFNPTKAIQLCNSKLIQ